MALTIKFNILKAVSIDGKMACTIRFLKVRIYVWRSITPFTHINIDIELNKWLVATALLNYVLQNNESLKNSVLTKFMSGIIVN